MTKTKYFIAAALMAVSFNSCSDMLDNDSDRYVYNPSLNEKVDSMFYINGILKGVQQAIDQNVLTNELRGDLLSPTTYASTDLHKLATFDYADGNKYDSAYVYYRIINNCNYYVAHRDTTLATGSTHVAMKEYAEAKAIRAWAYMQLARTYGSVPFYTSPLTNIADVEQAANLERKDMKGICDALAPDLEQYVNLPVPNWGNFDAGMTDNNTTKTVATSKMMFPVRLVLGDMYLETGQYAKATEQFFQYLKKQKLVCDCALSSLSNYPNYKDLPSAMTDRSTETYTIMGNSWESLFGFDSETQTYVAMASNKLRGQTTELPGLFGYNYYAASDGKSYNEKMSLEPSTAYLNLSNDQTYYYQTTNDKKQVTAGSQVIGDMRYHSSYVKYKTGTMSEPTKIINKYRNANIQVYRTAGIYLKLAEAVNRMGHPDVAFAVLKDGWNHRLEKDTTYMTKEGIQFLKTTLPFLTPENEVVFDDENQNEEYSLGNQGIHMRGCGYTAGNASKYRFDTEVAKKWAALKAKGYKIPATPADTLKAKIDAVEDLLCDEMALELAFEGSRFGDLCRIARHKNNDNPFASNYGSLWLRDKLSFKSPALDLSEPNNWFMPFK